MKRIVLTVVVGVWVILDTFANIGHYHRMKNEVEFVCVEVREIPGQEDYVGRVDPPLRN